MEDNMCGLSTKKLKKLIITIQIHNTTTKVKRRNKKQLKWRKDKRKWNKMKTKKNWKINEKTDNRKGHIYWNLKDNLQQHNKTIYKERTM